MRKMIRVGVDRAKNDIQVHAVDSDGKVLTNRSPKRANFLAWCADLPAGCLMAMEACSGAHHWIWAEPASGKAPLKRPDLVAASISTRASGVLK